MTKIESTTKTKVIEQLRAAAFMLECLACLQGLEHKYLAPAEQIKAIAKTIKELK
jgi:hypothetical protein